MVRKLIGAVALGAIVVAACSGATTETTTTTATSATTPTATTIVQGSVIFGNGSVPETVPDSFPIPDAAVIGTTLQDTESGRTEVVMVLPAEPEAVVLYYEENLPTAGYEVTRSEAAGSGHAIEFTGDGVSGQIIILVGSSNAATAALTLTPTG
jgi:hypothetical protein